MMQPVLLLLSFKRNEDMARAERDAMKDGSVSTGMGMQFLKFI